MQVTNFYAALGSYNYSFLLSTALLKLCEPLIVAVWGTCLLWLYFFLGLNLLEVQTLIYKDWRGDSSSEQIDLISDILVGLLPYPLSPLLKPLKGVLGSNCALTTKFLMLLFNLLTTFLLFFKIDFLFFFFLFDSYCIFSSYKSKSDNFIYLSYMPLAKLLLTYY